ncbi:MAG: hypothetical protein ABIE23_00930 [archaeon]
MKKIFMVLFFALFFSSLVSAANIRGERIEIQLTDSGNAAITEQYFLDFNGTEELNAFREEAKKNGNNINAWNTFNEEIFFHTGSTNAEASKIGIFFEEKGEEKFLRISYYIEEVFLKKERTDKINWSINLEKFPLFYVDEVFLIPSDTNLIFFLPRKSEVLEEVSPDALIEENRIEFNGYVSSITPNISYFTEKPLSPPEIKRLEIEITVKEDGFAGITERYSLDFRNQRELDEFKQINTDNGSSLIVWNAYDNNIFTRIGSDEEVTGASVSFIEEGVSNSYIRISYALSDSVFKKEAVQTTRLIKWNIDPKKFSKFQQGGTTIIPANTTITFFIPLKAELIGNIKPDAIVSDHEITWQGYKSDNFISLSYSLEKNIAPPIDTAKFVRYLVQTNVIMGLLAGVLVIALILYVKRRKINEKITDYVISHSSIRKSEKPEELETEFE